MQAFAQQTAAALRKLGLEDGGGVELVNHTSRNPLRVNSSAYARIQEAAPKNTPGPMLELWLLAAWEEVQRWGEENAGLERRKFV